MNYLQTRLYNQCLDEGRRSAMSGSSEEDLLQICQQVRTTESDSWPLLIQMWICQLSLCPALLGSVHNQQCCHFCQYLYLEFSRCICLYSPKGLTLVLFETTFRLKVHHPNNTESFRNYLQKCLQGVFNTHTIEVK